jgi:hypothetical protein
MYVLLAKDAAMSLATTAGIQIDFLKLSSMVTINHQNINFGVKISLF